MWLGWTLLVGCWLLPGRAFAMPRVAVLALDGYGVSYDDAQTTSRGVRDGFLEEGTLDPLDGYQIADTIATGHEDRIREARKLLAQARGDIDSGRLSTALDKLGRVLEIHERANSWVGRRPELADSHYFTAVALARIGRRTEALTHLMEVLYLYPNYDEDRAYQPSSLVQSLFSEAHRTIASEGPRTWSGPQVANIGEMLGVRHVVVGYVQEGGRIHLQMYVEGRLEAETSGTAEVFPLSPGEPLYSELAGRLARGVAAESGSAGAASSGGSSGSTSSSSGDGFHEIPTVETEGSEEGQAAAGSEGAESDGRSRRWRRRAGKIRARGGIRYNNKPVYQQWWFWTAIGVAAAGGGYYAYSQMDEGEPEEVTETRQSYTVVVETSGL